MTKKGYKDYGLRGKTIIVSKKKKKEPSFNETADSSDPWSYGPQEAKVIAETPYFIVVTILPHYNPHGLGLSSPYSTSLHKHDIMTGDAIIKRTDGTTIR